MTKRLETPSKSFETFRRIESKPQKCVVCEKVKPGQYKEDTDSLTNSSFVCLGCIRWAESVK